MRLFSIAEFKPENEKPFLPVRFFIRTVERQTRCSLLALPLLEEPFCEELTLHELLIVGAQRTSPIRRKNGNEVAKLRPKQISLWCIHNFSNLYFLTHNPTRSYVTKSRIQYSV